MWKLPIDQSFENENNINDIETCEIYMNDARMEERFENNPIVQTKKIEI